MIAYQDKINGLYAKMFGIATDILPANRESVNTYLHYMWKWFYLLTSSFESRSVMPFALLCACILTFIFTKCC
jgi:hypothetical protein